MDKSESYKLYEEDFCDFNFQKRKTPADSGGRGEKSTFWNIPEHSVLPNQACPQEKLVYQSLIYWELYLSLTKLGEGK